MSIFRRLSRSSKKDSVSNIKPINSTPPAPNASPIEEETLDNAGSNQQSSTARADDKESSDVSAELLMTSCLGSEIGKGR